MRRLDASEVNAFIVGQTLNAFDPDSLERLASVTYFEDGSCRSIMADGSADEGRYGLEGDRYWTKYASFRNGKTHAFYLLSAGGQIVQACFSDGRRAYLQSPLEKIERDDLVASPIHGQ